MKLFEIIPQPMADLLPLTLNQEIPSACNQLALQLVNTGRILSFAGIGLALKTRQTIQQNFNELVELGEKASQGETPSEAKDKETIETPEPEEIKAPEPEEIKAPSVDDLFNQATIDIKTLTSNPDNSTQIDLYALYKQSVNGDNSGKRPGITKITNRLKFDAWRKKKGLTQEEAKQAYTNKVDFLLASQ